MNYFFLVLSQFFYQSHGYSWIFEILLKFAINKGSPKCNEIWPIRLTQKDKSHIIDMHAQFIFESNLDGSSLNGWALLAHSPNGKASEKSTLTCPKGPVNDVLNFLILVQVEMSQQNLVSLSTRGYTHKIQMFQNSFFS